MTDRPNKVVVDCSTGETSIIPLTDEEIAANEIASAKLAEEKAKAEAEKQAKAEAKISAETKLVALGLTLEEIAAL